MRKQSEGLTCLRTLFPENVNGGLLEAGLEIKVLLLGWSDHCLDLFDDLLEGRRCARL